MKDVETRNHIETPLEPKEIQNILKVFPKGFVAIDLEMTGLSPLIDKIIEIAAVKINQGGEISLFHSLINPMIPVPEKTIPFHGLTDNDLKDAPSMKVMLPQFLEFLENLPLVAHNGQYDAGFLLRALHQFHLPPTHIEVLDSCKLMRSLYKKKKGAPQAPENFKLSTLAEFFHYDFTHHRALDDAFISFLLVKEAIELFEEKEGKFIHSEIKKRAHLFFLDSFKQRESYNISKDEHLLIAKAINEGHDIEIQYKGGSHGGDFRPIKPIALLPMPNGSFLYGKCLLSEEFKHFSLKKIKKTRIKVIP